MYYVEATPYTNATSAAQAAVATGEPAYYVDGRGRVSTPIAGTSVRTVARSLTAARRMSASRHWSGAAL